MSYAELHCHSYYSFHDGASSLEELMLRAKDLGYRALAITDHNNLCGAMCAAQLAKTLEIHLITGAEINLENGRHLTLIAQDGEGYKNLCRLLTIAHNTGERNDPTLPIDRIAEHAKGLIALSGCPKGELSLLIAQSRFTEAKDLIKQYLAWFGPDNYYIELQQNLSHGDTARNLTLIKLAKETGAPIVATGNVHYHVRERHRLQDCLVAVKHCLSLEETHRERRANSEYYLHPIEELQTLFPAEALANTIKIAERCTLDLTKDLSYIFPDYPTPEGFTPQTYLEKLCYDAAVRRYGCRGDGVTPPVQKRLDEEFYLIKKYNLSGFLLMYHEVIKLGREVMIEQGLSDPSLTVEENPPGRGRGSSVALLAGYLIGLSHIDPLKYNLSLERFLPADTMSSVPDIDLDFPRTIREDLILRTHEKWGWRHAALAGTIATYQIKGAVRDLGKALGLPDSEIDHLAKQVEWGSAKKLGRKMERLPGFKDKLDAPVWRDLISLASELDGFPHYMGQHPGGMILSSTPLTDIVPVQRGAIEGRYVCQWDKDSIDDANFVKIDFLALGALSQMQEAVELIKARTGERIDMSRINFEDEKVYDMLCKGDTIGIFQVESAAQMQTITRLQPRNLLDMAHEVAAVRPGVGANHGVQTYLARRMGREPVTYEHPLEQRSLERTLGVILFQDQVNQLAIDVAGFAPSEADRLRRAFGRKHNEELLARYHEKFIAGALERHPDATAAEKVFQKFNGQYMFPESHAFAFGVTAYQASWLKYYYPLEFFVAIFNQQPMGFYNLETLKEDAGRHGIMVLNPDINQSAPRCLIEPLSIHSPVAQASLPGRAGTEACPTTGSNKGLPKYQKTRTPLTPLYERGRGEKVRGNPDYQLPITHTQFALRLGFLNITGLGKASADAIIEGRSKHGPFKTIGEFLEHTGVLEEVANNLAGSGAFDSLEPNRRKVKWEIGLRYRPINKQLPLPLPVSQDIVELKPQTDWEKMKEEYQLLSLFPGGHVMARLRPRFAKGYITSRDIEAMKDGTPVKAAGLIIRRQRPRGKVVFVTLEDEFGHIPCMVFGPTYEKYEHTFRSAFVAIKGYLVRREGTCNVVINEAEAFTGLEKPPHSKDWR